MFERCSPSLIYRGARRVILSVPARVGRKDLRGSVRRAVIENEEFKFAKRLPKNAFDGFGQK